MNIKKTIYISIIIFLSVVFLRLFVFRGKSEQISRVVIITIDTLRADHLGSYGYKLNTSPFLDSIAKQGISFKNTFAATASTVPSHASLFTSLHPLQHGVLKNGHKLADDFLTMAEIFQEIGYKTAGITSTDRHFFVSNLHQGFSYYNEPTNLICFKLTKLSFRKLNENGVPNKILEKLQLLKKKAFPDKFTFLKTIEKQIGEEQTFKFQESLIKYAEFDMRYRSAQETIDVAINWLETIQPTEKFFLWIHLFDPIGRYVHLKCIQSR